MLTPVVAVDCHHTANRTVAPWRAGYLLCQLLVGKTAKKRERGGTDRLTKRDDFPEGLTLCSFTHFSFNAWTIVIISSCERRVPSGAVAIPIGLGWPSMCRLMMVLKATSMPIKCDRWSFALHEASGSCLLVVISRLRSSSGIAARVSSNQALSRFRLISISVRFISFLRDFASHKERTTPVLIFSHSSFVSIENG